MAESDAVFGWGLGDLTGLALGALDRGLSYWSVELYLCELTLSIFCESGPEVEVATSIDPFFSSSDSSLLPASLSAFRDFISMASCSWSSVSTSARIVGFDELAIAVLVVSARTPGHENLEGRMSYILYPNQSVPKPVYY